MDLFIKYCSFIFEFLLFFNEFSFAFNPASIGRSVDETMVYKTKKQQKTISDRSYDVFTALSRTNPKNKHTDKTNSIDFGSKKVFALRTINGEDVTNIDVLNVIKLMFLFSGKKYDSTIAKLMVPTVLDSLEDDKLRRQCANLFGIIVTEKDIDDKVSDIAKNNGYSVSDLAEKLKSAGISMKSFKEHIKSKMIFQLIAQSFAERKNISKEEFEEVKAEEKSKLNSERYCVAEIFRYSKDSINQIFNLIKNGFNFQILSETFSQNICSGDKDFMKWIRVDSFEPEVIKAIKNLNPGECSGIIETKAGYKIILLIDKAQAGKYGTLDSKYKILEAKMKYRGALFTEQDTKKTDEQLQKFLNISNSEKFKNFCKKYAIEFEEKELDSPNAYYMELINRSRSSGKAAALQSLEDEDYVNIVILLSESSPEAKLPTDKELIEIATEKKLEKEFSRNFKKIKFSAHIDKSHENIERIFK